MTHQDRPIQKTISSFSVRGMTCDHCQRAVENAVRAVPGVTYVAVELARGIANVSGQFSAQDIVHAIEGEGYVVTPMPSGKSG